ncbi:hypothetical protein, partial [Acetobacter orientalis]|uniref:hypothetical protein n=1 Tax=Acetobacter orientalis TaxID=146474 RepID=UPI0039E9E54F
TSLQTIATQRVRWFARLAILFFERVSFTPYMTPSLFWLDTPRVFNPNRKQKIQPEDRVSLSAVFSRCYATDPAGQ